MPSPPPEPEPELEDGFAVLRELLAAGEAATTQPDDDEDDGWVTPEEHELQVAEVARLTAALTQETQRAEGLRTELDEALDQAEGWEAQAAALRAERDELEAEAELMRIELAELRQAAEPYDGPERRSDVPDQRDDFDQRTQGERRRGLAPRVGGRRRPLRIRGEEAEEAQEAEEEISAPVHEFADDYAEPEPDDTYVEEPAEPTTERGPGWPDRLREVGDAAAAWGLEDLERLRAE